MNHMFSAILCGFVFVNLECMLEKEISFISRCFNEFVCCFCLFVVIS